MLDLSLPTPQTYAELQRAYEHFNARLFDDKLPHCLLTLQRDKRTYGYFSAQRFVHRDGKTYTDEIALNPSFFSVIPPREIMQTIVHEMVHAWQHHFGKPSRRSYHNQEWADKMESLGLMPSTTGEPGGAKTGEKMGDYSIEGGLFEQASDDLLNASDFAISWLDRFPPQPPSEGKGRLSGGKRTPIALAEALLGAIEIPGEKENKSNRVKQRCPGCGAQAWGKPGLKLLCGEKACKRALFEPAE